MERPTLVPIEYGGNLVALVSRRRVYIVDPVLRGRPDGDPDLRFVAYMCLCCGEVLRERLPGPYTNALGEAWARIAMADESERADQLASARLTAPFNRDEPGESAADELIDPGPSCRWGSTFGGSVAAVVSGSNRRS